jgi:Cys-rich protein (TIGR01571 family)
MSSEKSGVYSPQYSTTTTSVQQRPLSGQQGFIAPSYPPLPPNQPPQYYTVQPGVYGPPPGYLPQLPQMGVQYIPPGPGIMVIQQPGIPGRWRSHVLDCCVDGCGLFCHVCCCPCIGVGHNADLVGWNCCVTGTIFAILYSPAYLPYLLSGVPFGLPCSCLIHAPLRSKLRERYGINENCPGEDWCVTAFLPLCAICQEVHEVIAHGEARM